MTATRLDFEVPEAELLRRATERERQALLARDAFQRQVPTCPAGRFAAGSPTGPGCYCGVEGGEPITIGTQPSSLTRWCFGDYVTCPTWRAEKRRIAEARKLPLVAAGAGRKRRELVEIEDGVFAVGGDREGRDA